MPPRPLRRRASYPSNTEQDGMLIFVSCCCCGLLRHRHIRLPESRCLLLLLLLDALQNVVGALVPSTAAQPGSPGQGRQKLGSPGQRSGAATPLAQATEAGEDGNSRRGRSGGR